MRLFERAEVRLFESTTPLACALLAIPITNFHRRPAIATISGAHLNKETLCFNDANFHRWQSMSFGISLRFDPCEGNVADLRCWCTQDLFGRAEDVRSPPRKFGNPNLPFCR